MAKRITFILPTRWEKRWEKIKKILKLDDERYVLQLKSVYSPKVKRLAFRPLLTPGPLKTLAYIAYRQPIEQKLVAEVRGSQAYRHIKQLREMGLVEYEKSGETRVLRTTDYFADYFGLSHNLSVMKRQLRRIFEDLTEKEKSKETKTTGK